MEQQDRTARLKRAACRCRVQVVCLEHTCMAPEARRLSVSTTPPGQEPMPVVAVYQLLWKRCAYAVVKVR
jgi:hypothetical protein